MASYQEWNEKIFKYFFNQESAQDTIFFCVDKDLINFIGKELDLAEKAEDDFCKAALYQIIDLNNRGVYKLSSKNEYKCTVSKEIPYQTAIIAFFIYIASRMGENSEYRTNAFWPLFDEIAKKFYYPYEETKQTPIYDFLFAIFKNFKEILIKKHNIDFDFPNLFDRKEKRDFIGLPIFQSMISASDRCLLSQKFYEYKVKYADLDKHYEEIVKGTEYSNVFKKLRDDKEYHYDLIERVRAVGQSWDGTVYEYDMHHKKRERSIIPLIYQYTINSFGEIKVYLTASNIQNYDNLTFQDYSINKDNERIEIPLEKMTLKDFSYQVIDTKLRVAKTKSDYIIFKKDTETNLYTEIIGNSSIKIGDTFSVLAPIEFFNNEDNKSRFELIMSSYDDENSGFITDNLFLLHGAVAENYDNKFVRLDIKDKITIHKGIKSGFGNNSYIEGAEPIIEIKNMNSVSIDDEKYYISPVQEYGKDVYKKIFDIRKCHNNYGKHDIKPENTNISKKYEIVPISAISELNKEKFSIYNVIDKNLSKTKEKYEGKKLVFGACLENIEEISSNNNRNSYILKILKQHKNDKKFLIPQNLKEKVMKAVANDTEFDAYLRDNVYVDNYICKYLNELKEE